MDVVCRLGLPGPSWIVCSDVSQLMKGTVLLLGLLSLLAGCSKGYNICSAPIAENCRTFRSAAHYQRWVKGQSRRQLATAQHFPDDYREVVAATLKEYLQNNESEFPNRRAQYFVSVF